MSAVTRMLGRNATLVIATADLASSGWRIVPGPYADPFKGKLEALSYKACRDALKDLGSRSIDAFTYADLRAWDARERAWMAAQGAKP